MAGEEYGKIAREWYDYVNKGELDRAFALLHRDVEVLDVSQGQLMRGAEATRPWMQDWHTAFPDSSVEIQDLIETGDRLVVEFIARGTHSGPLAGPGGQIPPTGKRIELRGCDVFHFKDGKIYRRHMYYDGATMLRQLGLLSQERAA
ncbi:MAG: ester cyclase [Chloroflexi bacterium]|nr:ester cyclase [Chloroflexota bacterium]